MPDVLLVHHWDTCISWAILCQLWGVNNGFARWQNKGRLVSLDLFLTQLILNTCSCDKVQTCLHMYVSGTTTGQRPFHHQYCFITWLAFFFLSTWVTGFYSTWLRMKLYLILCLRYLPILVKYVVFIPWPVSWLPRLWIAGSCQQVYTLCSTWTHRMRPYDEYLGPWKNMLPLVFANKILSKKGLGQKS